MADSLALNPGIDEVIVEHDGNHVAIGYLLHTYKMDRPRRGKCIIFNHQDFSQHKGLADRQGTSKDCESLKNIFSRFGFEVLVYEDYYTSEILTKLQKVSAENHNDADCFVCCLLTHGESDKFYSCDGLYEAEKLWNNFVGDKCPTLVGKPKLFFIQACQGSDVDKGVVPLSDGPGGEKQPDAHIQQLEIRIPCHADFLIAKSCVKGYLSMRSPVYGSWFIQSLCECLNTYISEDIQTILTAVAFKVSREYETTFKNAPAKQMPSFTSMLTKKLYLNFKS